MKDFIFICIMCGAFVAFVGGLVYAHISWAREQMVKAYRRGYEEGSEMTSEMTREELLKFVKDTKNCGWHFTSNSGKEIPVDVVINKMEAALCIDMICGQRCDKCIDAECPSRICEHQEPCDDAISRATAKTRIYLKYVNKPDECKTIFGILDELPSVTPSRRKGHWEDCSNGWRCTCCDRDSRKDTKFCPNCGADMRGAE